MDRIKKLKEGIARDLANGRKIVEAAESESRNLTSEEKASYDKHIAAIQEARDTIKRIEQQDALEAELRTATSEPLKENASGNAEEQARADLQHRAFRKMLVEGPGKLDSAEFRALQVGPSSAGGFLVPVEFAKAILLKLKDLVYVRQMATVLPLLTADSIGIPALDTEPADADWTSEVGTGSEDSTMAFGKRDLRPHPLAKRIKVSKKLLRSSAYDVEALVRDRLAYKFGITEEKAFLLGTGAEQPLGVFTASASGISTGQDVSSGNTTTAIGADGLQAAKYKVKKQYRKNAQWLFHRDALKQIAQLKDGMGRYIFQPGLQLGTPDMLLGHQFNESEYAPNTFTTGLYVGIFGDFSYYHIADSLAMELQPLFELYAEANQVGFIGRKETDGMPVFEEAFARVTLA